MVMDRMKIQGGREELVIFIILLDVLHQKGQDFVLFDFNLFSLQVMNKLPRGHA